MAAYVAVRRRLTEDRIREMMEERGVTWEIRRLWREKAGAVTDEETRCVFRCRQRGNIFREIRRCSPRPPYEPKSVASQPQPPF